VLYVFHGKDDFRAREALGELRRELDRDGNLAHNTERIDGEDLRRLTPAQLRAACNAASFFAESRLVIIEGLLGRLRGAGRRGSRRGRGVGANGEAGGSESDEFIAVLADLPETTTVVLLEGDLSAAATESLPQTATVKRFEPLRRDALRPWAAARANSRGANFAPGALDRLVSLIDGAHLGELAGEIDKLATYANGRPITIDDVDEMVTAALDFASWDLTDAVIEGRADRALSVLRRLDEKDQPPQLLTFMLVRQYRLLLLTQAMLRDGLSAPQIGAQLGLSNFPLRKVIDQASRYPADALETAYRRLLESDVAVKTGVIDAGAALEILVVSLAELARAPRRTATRR
jgi:DNA polymerase-3 subunit delta